MCATVFDMITYTFKDDASYKYIVQNWNWVNGQVFPSFILTVTNKGSRATPDATKDRLNGIIWDYE